MPENNSNTLIIKTPEGISFSLLPAGPLTRFFAWGIDLAVIIAITTILSTLLYSLSALSLDFSRALTALMYFGVSIGYGILTEWYWRGQTLGKRLLRLRVVDENGLRVQFSQIVIRNLLRFVDALPALYLVGGIAALVTKKAQRLGDYAANTIVIHSAKSMEYDLEKIEAQKYNSFRDYPPLEARLRRRVLPAEAALAFQALVRRGTLYPEARAQLMKDIATHFKSLVTFPEEAALGLTDEQYVKNIVDIIFRPKSAPAAPGS